MSELDGMVCTSTLENGLRVVTERISGVRSVAMAVLADVGPSQEAGNQYGLAHLVEHCMFHGTRSRNATQIARVIDMAGGSMGAFTARDYTCYYATVLDEYYPYALDLLGDILLNSIFPEESLEREKGAVLREIGARLDAPDERAHELLKSYAWPNHALGRAITGNAESVQGFNRENVVYFVNEHYLPDRLIFAAAGNVIHEDLVAQVRDGFWRMLGQSKPIASVPPQYRPGVILEHRPVSQAYFALGIRAFSYAHPDRYALHVLTNVLGGGISSRLYRRIREQRGLAYSISSEYHAYRDDGMLVIEGSTAPEYLNSLLGLVLVEMWQLITGADPIDDEELWKAKMQIRGQHLISGENTHTRMSRLATQELYFGKHIPTHEILDQIQAVDQVALQHIADERLVEALRQVAIAVVGPEAPEAYSAASIQEVLSTFQ